MHVCFLTSRFPYPPYKGDTTRVYHQLRHLARDIRITIIAIAATPIAPESQAEVARYCERVIVVPLAPVRAAANIALGSLSRRPLQVCYYQVAAVRHRLAELLARDRVDLLHVSLLRMLPYVWQADGPPVLADLIDAMTLNLATRRRTARGLARLGYELEYRRVRRYEQDAVRRFPALVVSSPADREALDPGRVAVIPNGVDMAHFAFRGLAGRDPATVTLSGNMGYPPNEEAATWFAREVWPRVRAARPLARWRIVGADPSARVRALADESRGIAVVGPVPDMAEALAETTIAVCPVRSGSGVQNKVVEAMAVGTPVVASATANRGVQGEPGRDLLVADEAGSMAAAIVRLLDDSSLRANLGSAGRAFVERHFSWEEHTRRLVRIYAELVAERTGGTMGSGHHPGR